MKRGIVLILLVLSITTQSVSGADVDVDAPKATSIRWKNCTDATLQELNAQCGFVSVPLNHNKPNGAKIRIAVSRVRHNASAGTYQGVILLKSVGTGSDNLGTVVYSTYLPSNVSGTYDWIGFDPRGTGASEPALSCVPEPFAGPRPNYVPTTLAEENYWLNKSKHYAMACKKKYVTLIKHMTSLDTVEDMERIRIALGQSKINYYGLGYGTYLGQLYATLYPTRVRRMVLDSNIDPRTVGFREKLDQGVAVDRNIQIWFEWLAKYDRIYHLGNRSCEVESRWNTVLRELEKNPINGVIGSADWSDIFYAAATSQQAWFTYSKMFADWANAKDAHKLIYFYSSGNDNRYANTLARTCADAVWPQDWNSIRTTYWRTFTKAPIFTWNLGWYFGPCQYWPKANHKPIIVTGNRTGNLLLIGETLDAATSYEGNLEVRRRFSGARLIAVINGTEDGNSLYGNACVDNPIIEYLRSGTVPPRLSGDRADVECAAPDLPNPD